MNISIIDIQLFEVSTMSISPTVAQHLQSLLGHLGDVAHVALAAVAMALGCQDLLEVGLCDGAGTAGTSARPYPVVHPMVNDHYPRVHKWL